MKAVLRGLNINEHCDAQLAALGASVLAAAILLHESLVVRDHAHALRIIQQLEADEQLAFARMLRWLANKTQLAVSPESAMDAAASLLHALSLIKRVAERRDLLRVTIGDPAIRALAASLPCAAGPLVDLTMTTEPSTRVQECVAEIEYAVSAADVVYAEQAARVLDDAAFIDAFRTVELLRLLLEAHRACRDAARRYQYALEAAS